MPNKTLSVRDQDLPLWERAERAAKHERTTVSALVASALADKLGHTGTCRIAMYERNTPLRYEQFEGRWLGPSPEDDLEAWEFGSFRRPHNGKDYVDWTTFIAETARGRIAVYARYYFSSYEYPPTFTVHGDLDAARRAYAADERVDVAVFTDAGSALGRSGKRGEEVRWLDI